jgi:formate/nitrite transporter FocA (FNT family)
MSERMKDALSDFLRSMFLSILVGLGFLLSIVGPHPGLEQLSNSELNLHLIVIYGIMFSLGLALVGGSTEVRF